jgi:hypothetical protein
VVSEKNCPGMIIGRSSTKYVFYSDRKSKMAATAIHRLTLDPMGKCSNAFVQFGFNCPIDFREEAF